MLAMALSLVVPTHAVAGDVARLSHSVVRLVKGKAAGGEIQAGVEIRLGNGWKTYWRMPGDSGVPPDFDWSGSTNVAHVDVGWPAPHRMHDAGGESVGYKDEVLFPLTVRLKAPGRPARLDLKLFYAVCKNICIPARAEVSLDLDASPPAAADIALIRRFQRLVPAEGKAAEALIAARALMQDGKPALAVLVASQVSAGPGSDVFVEGFENAYFHAPVTSRMTEMGREFILPVDGIKDAAALTGKRLRITLVGPGESLSRKLQVE